jgi:hypothetical protein
MEPSAFTRERALTLPALALLVNLRKGTMRDELDQFVELFSAGLSASAFCQARQKLNPLALLALSEQLVERFRTHFALRRWHGRRLLAVDC